MAASGRIDCLLDCIPHFIHNVDLLDEQGQTPLHVATKNGHIKVSKSNLQYNLGKGLTNKQKDAPEGLS